MKRGRRKGEVRVKREMLKEERGGVNETHS